MKTLRSYIYGIAALTALTVGFSSCQDDIDAPTVDIPKADVQPNMTLLELKTQFWDEATNYAKTIEDPDDASRRFIIHGRVISSDEEGNVFKSLVIQDETAALAFSIDKYNLYLNYRVGQDIVLDVTGMEIGKYAGLEQIGRKSWYENGNSWQVSFMSAEYFQQYAQLEGLPESSKIDTLVVNSFSDIENTPEGLRKWQSQLVRFRNVSFTEGGKRTFSVYHTTSNEEQNTTIVDRNGSSMTVRTSGYCTFFNQLLPVGNIDLVGILSYYNTSWQIIMIDGDGVIKVGERPGTKEKPYTVEGAIEEQVNGISSSGWVKGYIVGAVAPEVENVTSNDDIQWEAPTVLANSLVIAPTATTNDISKCLVVMLPSGSKLQQAGNLRNNPSNLGKEILINGKFAAVLGTYGITDVTGNPDSFEIEGVSIDTGEVPAGDGQKATPYNCAQIVAMNPSSTTTAVQTGVWVKGYIVGSMPTGGSSTLLANTSFGLADAATTNLVIGPTADCTDASKCVGIQLPTSLRNALALANKPENLGKMLSIQGDIMKYCGGPGVKNATEYELEGGSVTPPGPSGETIFSSLDENEQSLPAGWTIDNINTGGLENVWSWRTYNDKGYLNGSGFSNGSAVATEAYAISPVIDLANTTEPSLTFDHAAKFQTTLRSLCGVYARTEGSSTWSKLSIPTWPDAGAWTFVSSGNVSLKAFAGQKVQIAFKYASSAEGADTWEVKNLKVLSTGGTGTGGDDPNPPTPPTPSGDAVSIQATSITNVPGTSTVEGYSIAIDQAGGSTAPAIHSGTSAIRLYADNTMEISGSRMTKIVITLAKDASGRYTTLTPSTGKMEPAQAAGDTSCTWVGDATSVTFTVGHDATLGTDGPSKRGQVRFTALQITPAK